MRGWMGMGTKLKLFAGIGVGIGIRVAGTVGDGYKYLFPCSSLLQLHWGCALGRNDTAASVLGS